MSNKAIKEYLAQLRKELSGSDKAIIRDALADAEEHLHTALSEGTNDTSLPEDEAMQAIIQEYGNPNEIADAYRAVETYASPTLARERRQSNGTILGRFFSIYADTRAWGALLYMFVAFLTGVIYFTWVTTGLALSITFALFIFGLPFAAVFVISIKGIGLLEGRIVEALLGIRMPRRSVFSPPNLNWRERLKAQMLDRYTWFVLAYMSLQGILGTIYFMMFVSLIAFSLAFMAMPITQLVFGLPIGNIDGVHYFIPEAILPLTVLFGLLLLTVSMHLAKYFGRLHGRYAKFMLVGE